MHRNAWLGGLIALMLAGCTGSFEVEQTEPIRVEVDGQSESSNVREDREQRFVLAADGRDNVDVNVEVRRISEEPTRIVIEVRDEDTDEVIEQRQVTTEGNGSQAGLNTQNLVINVQGRDNIVVIAMAQEGEADVTVSARQGGAEGSDDGTIGVGVDTGNVTDDGTGTNTTDGTSTNVTVGSDDGSTGGSGDTTTDTTTGDTTTGDTTTGDTTTG